MSAFNIGFIGLGNLGSAILTRFSSIHKNNIFVWNRTKKESFASSPFSFCQNPANLVQNSDLIFICLSNSNAVSDVFSGTNGLMHNKKNLENKIIVDLTSNHYDQILQFYDFASKYNFQYLECPILGSVSPALKGLLTALVSGSKSAFDYAYQYIKVFASNIFFLEEKALASKMKVINNLVLANFMTALAEALVLGQNIGIDKAAVLDILDKGGGKSLVLSAKKDKLLNNDFSTHFSSALMFKDLKALSDLAFDIKTSVLSAAVSKEIFALTFQKNISQLDVSAIYKIFNQEV